MMNSVSDEVCGQFNGMILGAQIPEADASVSTWLAYIEAMHPLGVELGLERMDRVARRLGLQPTLDVARCGGVLPTIVTVAGTNGKGSMVAALEAMCQAAGVSCGAYTSPHLVHFGERLRVNGVATQASAWVPYFRRVALACLGECATKADASAEQVKLTFFEFTTLAAFLYLCDQAVTCWILEIGLGGRLDAVNWLTPSLSIVTRVAYDHSEWLGTDLVQIAREKCGIFRSGVPALWGDAGASAVVDAAVRSAAKACGVKRLYEASEYGWDDDNEQQRRYYACDALGVMWDCVIPWCEVIGGTQPVLQKCAQLHPAAWAAALQAMAILFPPVCDRITSSVLVPLIRDTRLPGRFSVCWAAERMGQRAKAWIFDVAHNQDAVDVLVGKLAAVQCQPLWTVFGVLADKPWRSMIDAVLPWVSHWVLVKPATERSVNPEQLAQYLSECGASYEVFLGEPAEWYVHVNARCTEQDVVLVWGSFFTVGPCLARG